MSCAGGELMLQTVANAFILISFEEEGGRRPPPPTFVKGERGKDYL